MSVVALVVLTSSMVSAQDVSSDGSGAAGTGDENLVVAICDEFPVLAIDFQAHVLTHFSQNQLPLSEGKIREMVRYYIMMKHFNAIACDTGIATRVKPEERRAIETDLLNEFVERSEFDVPEPTNAELRQYVQEHAESYSKPTQIRFDSMQFDIAHKVLIDDVPLDAATEQAEQNARLAREMILAGSDFETVAHQLNGLCGKGIEIRVPKTSGQATVAGIHPDLLRVLLSGEAGELSEPVRTSTGIVIVRVQEILKDTLEDPSPRVLNSAKRHYIDEQQARKRDEWLQKKAGGNVQVLRLPSPGGPISQWPQGEKIAVLQLESSASGIGSVTLTTDDILYRYDSLPPWEKDAVSAEEAASQFVEQVIEKEVTAMAAREAGIDKNPYVSRMIEQKVEGLTSRYAYWAAFEKWAAKKKTDEKAVREYYEKNADRFREEPTLRTESVRLNLKCDVDGAPAMKNLLLPIAEKMFEKSVAAVVMDSEDSPGELVSRLNEQIPDLVERFEAATGVDVRWSVEHRPPSHDASAYDDAFRELRIVSEADRNALKASPEGKWITKPMETFWTSPNDNMRVYGYCIAKVVSVSRPASKNFETVKDEVRKEYLGRASERHVFQEEICRDLNLFIVDEAMKTAMKDLETRRIWSLE